MGSFAMNKLSEYRKGVIDHLREHGRELRQNPRRVLGSA